MSRHVLASGTPIALIAMVAGAVTLNGLLTVNEPVSAQPISPKVRVIPYSADTIESRLRPDDELVVVQRHVLTIDSSTIARLPTPSEALASILEFSNTVIVIDVEAIAGVWTEGGRWIETRINAVVRDILRQPTQPFAVGQQIEIGYSLIAELMIGKTRVVATASNHEREDGLGIRAGERYLVFLTQDRTNGALDLNLTFLLRQDGTLDSPTRPGSVGSPAFTFRVLHGHSVEEVRTQIQNETVTKRP
ncbi:MAG: hypothetical protein JW395_1821 [Nitrospira sp.]|nr:hypothetical protein [Nitrospira sp.]